MSKSVRDIAALAILVTSMTLILLSLIRVWPDVNRARSAIDPAAVTSGKPSSTDGGYYCKVPLE